MCVMNVSSCKFALVIVLAAGAALAAGACSSSTPGGNDGGGSGAAGRGGTTGAGGTTGTAGTAGMAGRGGSGGASGRGGTTGSAGATGTGGATGGGGGVMGTQPIGAACANTSNCSQADGPAVCCLSIPACVLENQCPGSTTYVSCETTPCTKAGWICCNAGGMHFCTKQSGCP
jgi:hypothetical protein